MSAISLKLSGCLICLFFMTCKVAKAPLPPAAGSSENRIAPAGEKFSDHVRTTDFQTPEQEMSGFRLPPGFTISLFAAEPDIGKPINMEFDAAGRLWVAQSFEYPLAAAPGSGRDRISVLEDTDGNGRADQFNHFANDLNIPIGLLPVKGGAIGFSIPNVYFFTDKDGDGKYDHKKILFGPFGHQDTHGMISNLIRGYDGWIHACHGFTNTSTVAGTDGDSVTMVSGNTFRFKEDGSRIEQTTYGRVNPFGYAFDEWGYLYSVDCHSKPIYQLINGAEYPHFGKKAPAIGFAPEMMSYELGSTALSGLVYYTGNQFPQEYQNSFYNGDVVTCRVNRNTTTWDGSSPVSKRQEDFLVSSDPWFRPVDIKMGPDGSMYVADFYNRIIGHYEVPLNHPGRDRNSGRIWKISYTGNNKMNQVTKDWTTASMKDLMANLNHPQLHTRMMIANQLLDRYGRKSITPLIKSLKSNKQDPKLYIQGLWLLSRLNALPEKILEKAFNNNDPLVQTHALRILCEMKTITAKQQALVLQASNHANPNVQRMATEVMAKFPATTYLKRLLFMNGAVGQTDSHLKYTTLVSIRQNLRNKKVMQDVANASWTSEQLAMLIKVLPDVPSELAASYTLDYLQKQELPQAQLITTLEYIGRYVSSGRLDQAISIIQNKFSGNQDTQYLLYQTIRKGIAQKGAQVSSKMKDWGIGMAKLYLQGDYLNESNGWYNVIIEKGWQPENPWTVINRAVVDGVPAMPLIWSEFDWDPTGKLHSPVFQLPASLSLKVYDSDIFKTETKSGISKNVLRIRLDKTKQVVGEYRYSSTRAMAAAKEKFQPVRFDLSAYKGQTGYIEVLDSSRNGGIGISAIEPALVSLPAEGPGEISIRLVRGAEIVADYKHQDLEPVMLKILNTPWADQKARTAAAVALMSISPERNAAVLAEAFNRIGTSPDFRQQLATAIGQYDSPLILQTLQKGLVGAPVNLQLTIAGLLVKSSKGIEQLLDAAKATDIQADLLDDVSLKERLMANSSGQQKKQLEQLMQGQTGAEDRRKLIAGRLKNYNPSVVTVAAGKQTFMQNCSMCHQIKGNGGMIGPQLDGIGNWGQTALTEKILNPNGNISEAFRSYNITLKNGKALSGLFRREEGETLIFANPGGQEFTVAKNDIKENVASKYTLMPDYFGKTLSEGEFDALIKFLLSTKE